MEPKWWIILYPLALPTVFAVVGSVAGYFSASKIDFVNAMPRSTLLGLIVVAIATAVVPNVGQSLYDLGMSIPVIRVVQNVSYFVSGFAIVAGWCILQASWKRWLLLFLIPATFAQPLLSTYAFIAWTVGGFAP